MGQRGFSLRALAVGVVLAGLSAIPAQASVSVFVWTGQLASTLADAADIPGGTPDAAFTYNGAVNWINNAPQNNCCTGNLAQDFLNLGLISGFSSPSGAYGSLAGFGASSLSDNGDSYSSFFLIFGAYSTLTPFSGTILHDDGASIYVDSFGNPVYTSPGETSVITGSYTLPAGAHEYAVTYVEGNGSPSVLSFTTPAVPELSTWLMMVLGFAGVALQMRRRVGTVSVNA